MCCAGECLVETVWFASTMRPALSTMAATIAIVLLALTLSTGAPAKGEDDAIDGGHGNAIGVHSAIISVVIA